MTDDGAEPTDVIDSAEVPDDGAPRDPGAPGARRRVPTWLLVTLGVSLGAVLGLGAAAFVGDGDDSAPTMTLAPLDNPYPPDQAANAEQFLVAWERYRNATFVAELSFARTIPGGEPLEMTRVVVQDPPRRVVRQGASVTTTDEDASLLCEPLGTETVCNPQPGVDYDATVAQEIAAWRTAITGDLPTYSVDRSEPGCFELQLVAPIIAPPYGDFTSVCFDEDTGALRSRQVTRSTGTDIEEATRLSGTVTDADWGGAGG
jgi:hypothetical protein